MNRIIFVDDDENILQGIRRMLRPMRDQWQLTFADSGEEALAFLQNKTYDAIVSDTRMPGMNGIELLNEVKQLYPNMIRIGLSGHTDEALALQSSKTTHQQLSKPCDSEALKETISKAIELKTKIRNDSLNELITKAESLPSLPSLYTEITELMQSEDGSIQEAGKLVAQDIGMTAKILQLVNSAFFGLARHIGSAEEAVLYLGFDVLRGLVLTVKLFNDLEHANKSGLNLEELWNRSLLISSASKHVAVLAELDSKDQDYAQMAGMLNDVGILFMAANMPEQYNEAIKIQSDTKQNFCDVEEQVFGCTHADAGGSLLGIWGLPDPIVDAVAHHHHPSQSPIKNISPLTAVHLANHFCLMQTRPNEAFRLETIYIEKLKIQHKIEKWKNDLNRAILQDKVA